VHWFRRRFRLQIQLQEILALVVGYGMAALLFRAFWPTAAAPTILVGLPVLVLYAWLGLAMSGPIILLRPGARSVQSSNAPHQTGPFASKTWAEWAWILIGIYWFVLGLFVIPVRLRDFQLEDSVLFGAVPILVALGSRFLRPSPPARAGATSWTHRAAVILLATWPIAWICLILLGNSIR